MVSVTGRMRVEPVVVNAPGRAEIVRPFVSRMLCASVSAAVPDWLIVSAGSAQLAQSLDDPVIVCVPLAAFIVIAALPPVDVEPTTAGLSLRLPLSETDCDVVLFRLPFVYVRAPLIVRLFVASVVVAAVFASPICKPGANTIPLAGVKVAVPVVIRLPELDPITPVPVTPLRSTLLPVRRLLVIVSVPDERPVTAIGGRLVFAPSDAVEATPVIDCDPMPFNVTSAVPPVVTLVDAGESVSPAVDVRRIGADWSLLPIVPFAYVSAPLLMRSTVPLASVSVPLEPPENVSPMVTPPTSVFDVPDGCVN